METTSLRLLFDDGPRKGEILECLPGRTVRIGRIMRQNTFSIKDPGISQTHLQINFDGENWTVSDLNSANGTLLNGKKIPKHKKFNIHDGDVVKMGVKTVLVVRIEKKIEGDSDSTVDKQSGRVLTRRTRAREDVVSVANGSKVSTKKNEPVDRGIDMTESHKCLTFPPRVTTRRTSSKLDVQVIPEIHDAPELLTDQNVEVIDVRNTNGPDLSGCQVKEDLPPLPAAKRPCRKRKTQTNSELQEATSLRLLFDEGPRKGEILECLPGRTVRIGRIMRQNTFSINDPWISQTHLQIDYDGENWKVSDLNSANGTLLNGKKIPKHKKFSMHDGDVVKMGVKTVLMVKIEKTIEGNSDSALDKQSGRVSTRRTHAREDVVRVADRRKVVTKKNEPVDRVVDLKESHKSRPFPHNNTTGRTSSKVDSPVILKIHDAAELLTDHNVEVINVRNTKDPDLSGCQVKADLPPLPAAKRPSRKRKTETNPENQDILVAHLNFTAESSHMEVNFSMNQPRHSRPRRAATKRYASEKNSDIVSGVFGDAKILKDDNLKTSVEQNNDCIVFSEELPWHRLPLQGEKRSSVRKDQSFVSEMAGSLLNASEKVDELENNILDHQEIEPECKLQEKTATTRNTGTKMNVPTNNLVSSSVNYVSQDNLPRRSSRIRHMQDDTAIMKGSKIQKVFNQTKKTRKGTQGSFIQSDVVLVSSGKMEDTDSMACKLQHEKAADTGHMKVGKQSPKEVQALKDLEDITLGQWFDRMEKHLPRKIDTVADEIIVKLKQKHEQFQQFVLVYYKN